jgi:TonB family protein
MVRSRSLPRGSSFALFLLLASLVPARAALAHDRTAPVLVAKVAPEFPRAALEAGVEGTVVMELYIDAQGSVQHVHVISTPGFGLDEAAKVAARQFKFKPATIDGKPVASQVMYEQKFVVSRTLRAELSAEPPVLAETARPEYETVVVARGPMTSASSSAIRDLDFELRPRSTPNDILRAVPGLVTAQHQGGGKADQIFLRGFDADHGTDVAVSVDGIPVNIPSHAHGQGYADLHFIIPEVMQTVEVWKGAYYPQLGDFNTAGAVNLVTRKSFDRSFVSLTGGWYRVDPRHLERDANQLRFLGVAAANNGNLRSYVAVEAAHNDGPFVNPDDMKRYNVFAKTTYDLSPSTTLGAMVTAYGSAWNSSGQIPSRLVGTAELPTRWHSLDPTEGGSTQRTSATAFLETRPDPLSLLTLRAYHIDYRLALFSNFTFFLDDPKLGDAIEQDDARGISGASGQYEINRRWRSISWKTTLGAQLRHDDAHVDLWDTTSVGTPPRKRTGRHVPEGEALMGSANADLRLLNMAFYLAEDVLWRPWLRTVVGLRGDYFNYDVDDLDEGGAGTPKLSGTYQVALLSPKASVIVTPRERFDLYLNFGTGFHSNDARLAVRRLDASVPVGRVTPRAYTAEVGSRARLFDRLDLAGALWFIHLESETVFEGDSGVFAPSDPTRRYGVDLELRARLLSWLYADADVTLAHARFVNGGRVPLAPRVAFTGGLTARHPRGWKAALRVRGVGDRPIVESEEDALFQARGLPIPEAQGYTLLDAFAGYATRRFEVVASLENLLGSEWREAQFANRSCSAGENQNPASPCSARSGTGALLMPDAVLPDVHYTPGYPLTLTLTGRVFF